MIRLCATFFAASLLIAAAPSPSPTPSPVPSVTPATPRPALTAFSSTGRLVSKATLGEKTFNVDADVAAWRRGGSLRIDLQKLTISTADPASSAMISQLLPSGGITVLFDQRTQMLTLWSAQTRTYYRTKVNLTVPKPKATPKPKGSPSPKASPPSPLSRILDVTNSMTQYDVYSETVELTGHHPVNGHMASVFHFSSKTQKHGGAMQQSAGDLALADDLSGIPLHFSVEATGNVAGTLSIDLLSISTATPDAKLFALPAGYKQVKSFFDVFHK